MDLVTKTNTLPNMGETVTGEAFYTIPGGKGANQAVAATRLGAEVSFIGCVGDDSFGRQLKDHLHSKGIHTEHLLTIPHTSTGIASITVSDTDNSIIVVPGANHELTPDIIKQHETLIAESDMVLLQLEIPLNSVMTAVSLAHLHNTPVILNPAPMQRLPKQLVFEVSYLTPNEHEFKLLVDELAEKEVSIVKQKSVVTQGAKGVMLYQNGEKLISGYSVVPVDTTGAGDTFNGALAVFLSQGSSLEEACQYANAAAALSVTKLGAQSGMPTLEDVTSFLKSHKNK